MCGRYTLSVGFLCGELRELFARLAQNGGDLKFMGISDDGEIVPGGLAPALVRAGGRLRVLPMRWGLPGRAGRLIINARGETAAEKPMFRRMMAEGRCALPAAGYYEWRDGDRQKHLIRPEARPAMYLAGLYRVEPDGERRFVVLTRAAYGAHARVHGRMPLTLSSGAEAREWLDGALDADGLAGLRPALSIEPLGDEQMRMDFEDD